MLWLFVGPIGVCLHVCACWISFAPVLIVFTVEYLSLLYLLVIS